MANSTHAALSISEVLDMICARVENKSDLARLARTSTCWFRSSIMFLWQNKIDFRNILQLIPGVITSESFDIPNNKVPAELTEEMFNRLVIYAPWITSVNIPLALDNYDINLSEELAGVHSLIDHTSRQRYFPRLRTLAIYTNGSYMTNIPDLVWCFLFISPSIVDVDWRFGFSEASLYEYIDIFHVRMLEVLSSLIFERCSKLDKLNLSILPRPLHEFGDFSWISWSNMPISNLSSLVLAPHFCQASTFEWLQQLPSLRSLDLTNDFHVLAEVPLCSVSNPFPVLSKLRLSGFSLISFSKVLQPFVVSRVTKLILELNDGISCQQIADMLKLVAIRLPRLSALTIRALPVSQDEEDHLPLHIIQSLPLTHLDLLQFSCSQLHLPDGLRSAYSYWPKLEILYLDAFIVDYADLVGLSVALPRLLEIAVDLPRQPPIRGAGILKSLPILSAWPDHNLKFTALSGPYSAECAKSQLEYVGMVLTMAWPGLSFIRAYGGGEDKRGDEIIFRSIEFHLARVRGSLDISA